MKQLEYVIDVALLITTWVLGLSIILVLFVGLGDSEFKYALGVVLLSVVSIVLLLTAYTLHWRKRSKNNDF